MPRALMALASLSLLACTGSPSADTPNDDAGRDDGSMQMQPGSDSASVDPQLDAATDAPDAGQSRDATVAGDASDGSRDGGTVSGGPADRGATVPWDEHEAESAETNASVLGPSSELGTIEAES